MAGTLQLVGFYLILLEYEELLIHTTEYYYGKTIYLFVIACYKYFNKEHFHAPESKHKKKVLFHQLNCFKHEVLFLYFFANDNYENISQGITIE